MDSNEKLKIADVLKRHTFKNNEFVVKEVKYIHIGRCWKLFLFDRKW